MPKSSTGRAEPFPGAAGDPVRLVGGVYAVLRTPLDALPDLSDVQVIVTPNTRARRRRWSRIRSPIRSPRRCCRCPKSKVVRGFSFFGASFVYIIFEDGTDIYWARSRVLEYLNFAAGACRGRHAADRARTPPAWAGSTSTRCWPKDKTLAELRTIQDWYLRYQLTKAHGVSPKWRPSAASCRPTRSPSIR